MNTIPSMLVLVGDRKIVVLKYADDLVLCSVTSDGLQAGVNTLFYCLLKSILLPARWGRKLVKL